MSNLLVNGRDQDLLLCEQLGIEKLFKGRYADYSKESADRMLNATPFLETLSDVLVGHFSMQSGLLASSKLKKIYQEKGVEDSPGKQRALARENSDVAYYAGKIAAARYYAANILSSVEAHCETVNIGGKTPLEIPEESFTV